MTPQKLNALPDSFPPDLSEGIRDSRTQIATLREALLSRELSPTQLIACLPGLSKAAAALGAVEYELRVRPGSAIGARVTRDLKSLQSELDNAAKLIERGAAFHQGWARVLGSAAAGYTASGDGAPLAARGTVALQG